MNKKTLNEKLEKKKQILDDMQNGKSCIILCLLFAIFEKNEKKFWRPGKKIVMETENGK